MLLGMANLGLKVKEVSGWISTQNGYGICLYTIFGEFAFSLKEYPRIWKISISFNYFQGHANKILLTTQEFDEQYPCSNSHSYVFIPLVATMWYFQMQGRGGASYKAPPLISDKM